MKVANSSDGFLKQKILYKDLARIQLLVLLMPTEFKSATDTEFKSATDTAAFNLQYFRNASHQICPTVNR